MLAPVFLHFILDSSSDEETLVAKVPVKALPVKKKDSSSESSSDSDEEPEVSSKAKKKDGIC